MSRKLTLKRETLSELSRDELRGVAGAALPTLPAKACLASDQNCAPTLEPSCIDTCRCTPAIGQ